MPLSAPVPAGDAARVAALRRLGVLDQPPAPDLDGLTRLAAYVTGAPVCVLNLLDADRQSQAAATGVPRGEVPRGDSMCAWVVAQDDAIHVADAAADDRFAANPFVDGRIAQARMYASVPVRDADGHAVATLCVVDPQPRRLSPEQLTALADLAAQAEALLEQRRQHLALVDVLAEVDHAARHDPLTGLANRRVLFERLEVALARALRSGLPPTLLFGDLDGFKAVNDTHGHRAGDEALVALADCLRGIFRPSDVVARFGGDEFVVLCEDVAEVDLPAVVARMRAATAGAHSLRLSVGVYRAELGSSADEALAGADAAMYAEKARRRHAVAAPR